MAFFLAGLLLLLVIIFGARLFATVDPRRLAGLVRRLGGVVALAIAAFLTARGALALAIPLAVFGFALVGGKNLGLGGSFGTGRKSPGQKSEIRTEWLVMELDHDSGRMEGRSLRGKFAGRTLAELSETELLVLLDELRAQSGQDAVLLEAYLDRRFSGWREKDAGGGRSEPPRGARARAGRMSTDEAYAVLGLEPGAKADEIRDAHRRLMKKLHPDQGGSNYLAARINEAKEVLLGGK